MPPAPTDSGCGSSAAPPRVAGDGRDAPYDVELHTGALDSIVAHNAGDMTATLQAGVPLAAAQEAFAQAGQMLSLDPPVAGAGDEPRAAARAARRSAGSSPPPTAGRWRTGTADPGI